MDKSYIFQRRFFLLFSILSFFFIWSIDLCCYGHSLNKLKITAVSPHALDEFTINGTIISAYNDSGQLLFSIGFPLSWNSYCSSVPGEIHAFVRGNKDKINVFSVINRPDNMLRSAYIAYTSEGLFVNDRGNNRNYQVKLNKSGDYALESINNPFICQPYRHNGYIYTHSSSDNRVQACKTNNTKDCDTITIHEATFPYVYAGNEENDVVVTNWGDVLFHSKQGWCRGVKVDDTFKCSKDVADLESPRGMQMYSSINTDEGTLLGEWPTGRLWQLGKGVLSPKSDGPYVGDVYRNLELQSMASFCGELYIGFWPFGDVWKKSLDDNTWKKVYRLFSHPNSNSIGDIPYLNLLVESGDTIYPSKAFFGQRSSGMANYQHSLFISSSNLSSWSHNISNPSFLSDEEIDEYGKIHYQSNNNCVTTVAKKNINLSIELSSENLIIYNNQDQLISMQLQNFDVTLIKKIVAGDGVFGKLSDKDMIIQQQFY